MPRRTPAKRPHRSAHVPAAQLKPVPRPDPESLDLVLYPDPVLKHAAREVGDIDDYIRALAAKMKQLMELNEGVGLAAPQVGVGLRLFVFSPTGKAADAKALINPKLVQEAGSEDGEEGCLSLPDVRAKITRYLSVHVDALDENGEPVSLDLAEYPARIVQHEYDHLNGILITDRMSPVAKLAARRKLRDLEAQYKK